MRRVTPGGIMVMTAKEMQEDRPRWLRLRRFREGIGYCIGSSDLPSILGIKDSGTPVKVWHEKVHGIEQPDNPHMMWGRLHEDTIARYWRDRNRSAVRSIGLVAAVDRPWAQASLDRAVLTCPLDRASGVCALEIKTRGPFGSRRFHHELPDDVLAQICWQLIVSGYDHVHYAILVGGNDYRQGVVRAKEDEATIAFVLRQVEDFRSRYLAGEFIPELAPTGPAGELAATGKLIWRGAEVEPEWPIEEKAASLIELDGMLHPERAGLKQVEELGDLLEFAAARARVSAAQAAEKIAKARILRQADGARWVTTPTLNGPELAYEFAPRERTKVNLDILREKYPKAYADPEVVVQTTSWQINIADAYKVKKLPQQPEEES
jgi:putative phage-type endonuclease